MDKRLFSQPDPRSRYRARVLSDVEASEDGIAYREQGERCVLEWDRVRGAFGAEVGEPEGVRTIVFDLVTELGDEYEAYRFDADPGEEAEALARAIDAGLGPERPMASIKSLATDGIPSRWYPDLESFEEAALEAIAFG